MKLGMNLGTELIVRARRSTDRYDKEQERLQKQLCKALEQRIRFVLDELEVKSTAVHKAVPDIAEGLAYHLIDDGRDY